MELRLLNEQDMPELASAMNDNYTQSQVRPEELRVWFKSMAYIPAGIFIEGRLAAFAFCLREGVAIRAKDVGLLHEYRSPEYSDRMLEMFKDWARDRGAERLIVETCANELRAVELYKRGGLELKKHLPNRNGAEHGLELEVGLGG